MDDYSYDLFNFSELVIRILSIPQITDEDVSEMPDQFRFIFEDFSIKNIHQDEIFKLQRELDNGVLLYDIMHIRDIKLSFYPEILQFFSNSEFFKANFPKHYTIFVFYNFLSWISTYDICHDAEFLPELLKSLQIIYSYKQAIPLVGNIAASAFLYCYERLIRFPQNIFSDEIISLIEEYFLYLESLPPHVYHILALIADQLFKASYSMSGLPAQFLDFFTRLAKIERNRIPSDVYETFMQKNVLALSNLDIFCLKYFKVSVKYIPSNLAKILFEPICSQIIKSVEKNIKISLPKNKPKLTKVLKLPEISNSKIIYKPRNSLLIDDHQLTDEIVPKLNQNCKNFPIIDNDFQNKINCIISAVKFDQNITESLIKTYFNILVSEKKEKSLLQLLVLFYIVDRLSDKQKLSFRSNIVFNQEIFSPNITVFDTDHDDFVFMNVLRYHAIRIISKCCSEEIGATMVSFAQYPHLYTEILLRFLYTDLNYESQFISSISLGFMFSFIHYSDYSSIKQQLLTAVKYSRSATLILLEKISNDFTTAEKFFDNGEFAERFYSLFFEEGLHSKALNMLKSYLSKAKYFTQKFIHATKNFLTNLFQSTGQFNWQSIARDVLHLLNDTMKRCHKIENSITFLADQLCMDLSYLTVGSNFAVEVLMEIVSFLAITTHGATTISTKNLVAIEACIQRITKQNVSDEIIDKLLDILSGNLYTQGHKYFKIAQPNILTLLVRIFSSGKRQLNMLKFLIDLFKTKPINIWKSHQSGFDMTLLDLLDVYRIENNIESENIDMLLSLLNLITSSITSSVVVQRYFALLSSIDGEHLPYYHKNIVLAIKNCFKTLEHKPDSSLLLDANSYIIANNLSDISFNTEFSFTFWLFYINQKTNAKQIILSVKDAENKEFRVTFQSSSLNFVFRNADKSLVKKETIQVTLHEYSWNVLTFTYSDSKIAVYCNRDFNSNTLDFCNIVFKSNNLTTKINQQSQKYKNLQFFGIKISYFTLFNTKIDFNTHIKLCYHTPHTTIKGNDVIFSMAPHMISGRFKPSKYSSKNVKLLYSHIRRIKREPTFPSLFITVCNVENVIPLFAQLDLEDLSSKKSDDLSIITVKILKSMLGYSKFAQISFCDINGFYAISHLLISADSRFITFELYKNFYELSLQIKHKMLLHQLYETILLNFDIWIRANNEDHKQILLHYLNNVFKNSYPRAIISYSAWSAILRCYYWYNDVESLFIVKKRFFSNDSKILNEYRKIIFDIMTTYIDEDFKEHEYQLFMKNLLTSQDDDQTFDLLGYIVKTLISPTTPNFYKDIVFKNIEGILHLISRNKPELTGNVIQTITYIFETNDDRMKGFHLFVFQILFRMLPVVCTDFTFKGISGLIDAGNMQLIPIYIYIALNIGEDCIKEVFRNLPRNTEYYFNHLSLIYPILAAFKSSQQTNLVIFDFLITVFQNYWTQIYVLIQLLGNELNMTEYAQLLENIFLQNLVLFMIKNPKNQQNALSFAKLLFNYIFFRPVLVDNKFQNLALNNLYINSEFCNENAKIEEKPNLSIVTNPSRIQLMFKKVYYNQHFCMRFDENNNNEWADSLLSIGAVSVFAENFEFIKKTEHQKYLFLLLGYLVDIDSNSVASFFEKVNDFNDVNGLSFIVSRFNRIKEKVPDVIPSLKIETDQIEKNAFEFVENIAKEPTFFEKECFRIIEDFTNAINESNSFMTNIRLPITELNIILDDKRKERLQKSEESWMSMWRSMTQERAPWNSSLPAESRNLVKYKRDRTVCNDFMPIKMRRNYNFDDHKMASYLRDTGNIDKAQEKLKNEQEECLKLEQSRSVIFLPPTKIKDRPIADLSNEEADSFKNTIIIPCELVTIKCKRKAHLAVNSRQITITKFIKHTTLNEKRIVIDKRDIKNFLMRSFKHRPYSGFEIFTETCRNYLIRFEQPSRSLYYQILKTLKIQPTQNNLIQTLPFMSYFSSQNFTKQWVNGEISNFEYLMILNELSGRTFNSASMYPVFPWIIKEFDTQKLDLSSPAIYRDLLLPVGCFNLQRLRECEEKMEELIDFGMSPHLYSAGYSNPLSVYLWLLRVEPFTSRHIKMQSGKFDASARLFFSIKDAFRLCNIQMGDFRELIPEFFFDIDFLLNKNGFDLGGGVNDVILPSWAHDVIEFVFMNRKALESDFVSSHLNEWIDLIFGVNQRGKGAEQAKNIFKRELYDDIWEDPEIKDDEARILDIETQLTQVGQIPPQLFKEPHPKRLISVKNKFAKPLFISTHISKVSDAFINNANDAFKFKLYTESNNFMFEIDFDILMQNDYSENPYEAATKSQEAPQKNIVTRNKGEMLFFIPDEEKVVKYSETTGKEILIGTVHTDVSSADTDNEWVVLAGTDAALLIIRNSKGSLVRTYRDTISKVCVSASFDLAVAASRDSSVHFLSLNRAELTKVVELPRDSTVTSMSIGPSMGVVVCLYTQAIDGVFKNFSRVYTVNGDLAREKSLDFEPSSLCVFAPARTGIDTFFIGSTDGRVVYGECLSMDSLQEIGKFDSKIVNISYIKNENIVVVVTENGNLFIIPYN